VSFFGDHHLRGVWKFVNTPLGLLLLGFSFTTVLGGILTARLQQMSWERQTQLALFEKRYDEGAKLLDELSNLVGRRYFLLQRYLWAIQDRESYDLQKVSEDYFASVIEWNTKIRTMRNKTRLLIGEAPARRLLDYDDDGRPESPSSLHYIFAKVHASVGRAKSDRNEIDGSLREVERLNFICSELMEDFTAEFLRRAQRFQLLDLPKGGEQKTDGR
jgi:hypothetical protein